jgi:hypothetical protein
VVSGVRTMGVLDGEEVLADGEGRLLDGISANNGGPSKKREDPGRSQTGQRSWTDG